ncbi:M3 family peptidase [Massilia glaciei]|uniref:M3 family peptidase n=2 Tax=Massilia glaciei TaxID=1524097 RepID=A0A2U2HDP3_9BURK|nr:M3 family peptidase [Massilia glaciei]
MLILAASLAFVNLAAAPVSVVAAPTMAADNPFAKVSTLPFRYPAFDKIQDKHYMPAFNAGMREDLRQFNAIANNPQAPTFDNTIVAMERSGQLLTRVNATFSSMLAANTNDALNDIDSAMAPRLAAHSDAKYLNQKMFKRVKALYDKRAALGLDPESAYLLERYHKDFVRAGAQLSDADKKKLKAFNGKIATLQTKFSQNVLKEANASALVVDTRAELAGMSEAAIDTAAAEAKTRKLDGKFVVALVNTSGQPPLSVLTNRAVRERLMAASLARGTRGGKFDNRDVVLQLTKLRAERAALLGYPTFAAYSLEDQTAKTTDAVNTLLSELAAPAVANARREAAEIQKIIDAETGAEPGAKPGGFKVAAHDWAMYSDKVRAERFNFDEAQLMPYFEMDNVLVNGVFFAATKLYGITFKERKDLPVYNPDVRVFDVFDTDGKQIAIFLADFYARSNKRGGAWMNEFVSQSKLMGTTSVVTNNLNVPKPPAGEPTLLTVDEVKTMFHEFGHALHGLFSNVTYPRFSGTNVPRDFVEYPSQVNEMWMIWPEVLGNYAKHHKTGESMPRELLEKVMASKKFNQGFLTTEYLAASLLDQRWHQLDPAKMPKDVLAFEAASLKDAGVDFAPVPPRYRSAYFSHSMGDYSAGYYSYLWSEKLDADTVQWFLDNGGLDRKNGDHFRKTLLSRGGTADALQLFRNFRGRDAKIEALLERRGLKAK